MLAAVPFAHQFPINFCQCLNAKLKCSYLPEHVSDGHKNKLGLISTTRAIHRYPICIERMHLRQLNKASQ